MEGSIGKGLLGSIAGQMGGMSGDQMKQAENIWKMLDNLSESDPEAYKNFVKNNMKQGMEEIKKEQDQKQKEQQVQVEPAFLLKMQATLQSAKIQPDEHPLYNQFKVIGDKKVNELRKTLDKEVKIYVNVLSCPRVRYPLDDKGKEVSEVRGVDKWKVIPYSVQDPQQRKSESLGNMVYFYDFVVNDEVCKVMSGSPPLVEQLVTFVIEKMANCLRQHRNPLLQMYNCIEENELLFYQITKMSVVRHRSKKFKISDSKIKSMPSLLLEPEADRNFDLGKVRQQMMQQKANLPSEQTAPQPIKDVSDLTVRQQQEKEQLEKQEEQVLDGLKIVTKSQKESTNQQKNKKPIIEEIPSQEHPLKDTKEIQPKRKTAQQICEESIEKPSYTLRELTESLYLEIILQKVDSISDMILDISEKSIKLEVPLVYKLDIPLPIKVSTEDVNPKWSKKTKVLKLTLLKSN